jgi:hypothetical protein
MTKIPVRKFSSYDAHETNRRSIDGNISNSIFGSSEAGADVSREALQLIMKLPGMNSNGLEVKMRLARWFGTSHLCRCAGEDETVVSLSNCL